MKNADIYSDTEKKNQKAQRTPTTETKAIQSLELVLDKELFLSHYCFPALIFIPVSQKSMVP